MLAASCSSPRPIPDPPAPGSLPASIDTRPASGPRTVVIFTRTKEFHHDSIATAGPALAAALSTAGFRPVVTDDPSAFDSGRLGDVGSIVFLMTTGDVLDGPRRAEVERFVREGGGFVGVHSALDTEYGWPFYEQLIGTWFLRHPAVQQATVHLEQSTNPALVGAPTTWSRVDEWYDTRANPRASSRVLATVDERSYTGGQMGGDHAVMWCRDVEQGRSFVDAMGHTDESWADPAFVEVVARAARWAADRGARCDG